MIIEAKALVVAPATKLGIDLHDVPTSASTSGKMEIIGHRPSLLCPLCSEVLLDLAHVLL